LDTPMPNKQKSIVIPGLSVSPTGTFFAQANLPLFLRLTVWEKQGGTVGPTEGCVVVDVKVG
jgi:hypothetical protein